MLAKTIFSLWSQDPSPLGKEGYVLTEATELLRAVEGPELTEAVELLKSEYPGLTWKHVHRVRRSSRAHLELVRRGDEWVVKVVKS